VKNKKRMEKGKGNRKGKRKGGCYILIDFSYILAATRRELRNIKEYQRRSNFDKIPQQHAGCST
jgi:hypothetical protein